MEITRISIPKVLFIKGVYKKDCITDDIFEQQILENMSIPNSDFDLNKSLLLSNTNDYNFESQNINYNKLPQIFSNINSWPKKTNLLCWHCSLNFNTVPIFIPKAIEPIISKNTDLNDEKYSISIYGVFCSFGCAWKFIDSGSYSKVEKIEQKNKLSFLYKYFYKVKMQEIISYPEPYIMKQYGGELSIEEYKHKIDTFKTKMECEVFTSLDM